MIKGWTDDETGPSVRPQGDVWNTCLRSGGVVLIGVGMVTFFVSTIGSKLVVSEGSEGGTQVGLE